MKEYKIRTVSRRVHLLDLHRIEGDTYDIVYKERRRMKPQYNPLKTDGLTFLDNGTVIAWGDNSVHFTPATFRFLQQLWVATDHTLSKEEVREYVVFDEDASAEVLRTLVKQARKEMRDANFPHQIETIRGKGYKFIVCSQT